MIITESARVRTRLMFLAWANARLRLFVRVRTWRGFQHGTRSVSLMCLIHILFSLIQDLSSFFFFLQIKTCLSLFVILYSSLYNSFLGFSSSYYPILVPHSIYIDTKSLPGNSNATLANKHKQTNSVP